MLEGKLEQSWAEYQGRRGSVSVARFSIRLTVSGGQVD